MIPPPHACMLAALALLWVLWRWLQETLRQDHNSVTGQQEVAGLHFIGALFEDLANEAQLTGAADLQALDQPVEGPRHTASLPTP